MKTLLKLSGIVATLALAACATTQQEASTENAPGQAKWMYIVHSPTARIAPQPNGQYKLDLYQVIDVRGFTNRPLRQLSTIPADKFVAEWSVGADSFAKDNPNAAISAVIDTKNHLTGTDNMVTLKSVHYDAKKHILSFDVTKLGSQVLVKTKTLNDTTLFIDWCVWKGCSPG